MVRSFSLVLVCLIMLITLPLWLGLGGGLIGLVFGLIGAIIGLIFGLFGAIIGGIAWIFKSIFHFLFGWHADFGFHHDHHFRGYLFAAIVVLIIVAVSKRKK